MTDIANIKKLYLEGISPFELEKIFSISQGKLNTILKDIRKNHSESSKFVFIRRHKHRFEKVINMFNNGMSVNKISKNIKLSRSTINRILKINGITPRNQSQSETLKWSQMSKEQRLNQTKKAHEKLIKIGYIKPIKNAKTMRKAAITKSINKKLIGKGEKEFLKWIKKRNYPAIPQAVIKFYNIDILIGDLAVEIHNCTTAPHLLKSCRKKIKYLLNRDINVLYIKIKGFDIQEITANYAISFFEEIRRNPPIFPQYRMIRGNGELVSSMCLNTQHDTLVPSPN